MKTASGGYTIVEVLIVLAITVVLFFSAILVFSSQRQGTDFSQSMQDLDSTIQSYANQVQTNSFPGSENYACSSSSGHALLTAGGSGVDNCLFLGIAVQAPVGASSIQAYTVLGNKDSWVGGVDTHNEATTISQASPEPAVTSPSPPQYVLTDTYQLGAGATIKSVSANVGSSNYPNYTLAGFYTGLAQDNVASSTGTNALVLRGYACGSSCAINSAQVLDCIEQNVIRCLNQPKIDQWAICIDAGSNDTALLTVASAPGGVTTKVSITSC